jgi:hypothetical protein
VVFLSAKAATGKWVGVEMGENAWLGFDSSI